MSDLPALDHHPLAVWDEPVSERRPPTAGVLATLEQSGMSRLAQIK